MRIAVFLVVIVGIVQALRGEEMIEAYVVPSHGEVIISRSGEDILQLAVVAWGPNWKWVSFKAECRSEQGMARATMSGDINAVPMAIAMEAASVDERSLVVSYELSAERETDITLIAVALRPGKIYHGRQVEIVTAAGQKTSPCPFGRGEIGNKVSQLTFGDADGSRIKISLSPPPDIFADGEARIALASQRLMAQKHKLQIKIELPQPVRWHGEITAMPPDEDLSAWYEWKAKGKSDAPSVLDMADWLERPAGKHGYIQRQDNRLIYNGKPIKIWGINLCYRDCAPDKKLADKRAMLYARYGINGVRLHKYADGHGWAGIQAKDSFVEFDPVALDLMDYLVAKLKAAGIYVSLSPHFGTLKLGQADKKYLPYLEEFGALPKAGGGRLEIPASAVYYDHALQDIHIMQIVNLLQHQNPYTGLRYADDPAIAFVEIINEQSVLFYTSMGPLKTSATLRQRVGQRFCEWLKRKYGDAEKLQEAWGKEAFNSFGHEGFTAFTNKEGGESLARGNILPLGNPWYWDPGQLNGSQKFRRQRLLDSLQFLYEIQCEFYQRAAENIRKAGYKGEIIASNWQAGRAYSHYANLHSDYLVGTIDRHNYTGGEQNGKIAFGSLLAKPGSGLLSTGLQQIADRPFMISEWIHVFPNEWGVEGPAIISAYGLGLQGWDASFIFQNRDNGGFVDRLGDPWNAATAPHILGVFPAVARQIHRGDVKESEQAHIRYVHVPSLFAGCLGFEDKISQGYDDKDLSSNVCHPSALAAVKAVVQFADREIETTAFDISPYRQGKEIVASTGQLRWMPGDNPRSGYIVIDTPGTKAIVGFAAGKKIDLGLVTIEPHAPFAAIYVTARNQGKSLADDEEWLIVALGRCRNKNMRFTPHGDRLIARGEAPLCLEPIKAAIAIKPPYPSAVIALDHDGAMTDKALEMTEGAFSIDGASDKTPYYLIKRR